MIEATNVSKVHQYSPFRYPGGKTWFVPTAEKWLTHIGRDTEELVGVFAGGASVELSALFGGHVPKITLVELDPGVCSVWRSATSRSVNSLVRKIRSFYMTRGNVNDLLHSKPVSCADQAFKTIVLNRVSYGGILNPRAGFSHTGENGRGVLSRWYPDTICERLNRIYRWRHRVSVVEGDGLQVIQDRANNPRTSFFIDPPYRSHGHRLYRFGAIDLGRLFGTIGTICGHFLITYEHDASFRELCKKYSLEVSSVAMVGNQNMRKSELIGSRSLVWSK